MQDSSSTQQQKATSNPLQLLPPQTRHTAIQHCCTHKPAENKNAIAPLQHTGTPSTQHATTQTGACLPQFIMLAVLTAQVELVLATTQTEGPRYAVVQYTLAKLSRCCCNSLAGALCARRHSRCSNALAHGLVLLEVCCLADRAAVPAVAAARRTRIRMRRRDPTSNRCSAVVSAAKAVH